MIRRQSQSRSNTTRDQMPQPDRCPEVGHDRGVAAHEEPLASLHIVLPV